MLCSINLPMVIPLSAEVTTANIFDKPVYPAVLSCLFLVTIRKIYYVVADPGFISRKLFHDLSTKIGFQLINPVKNYENTPIDRLKLVNFYEWA